MEAKKLVIGQRYFLDSNKDVSGIYIGNTDGGHDFNEIEDYDTAKNKYGYVDDGVIGFSINEDFYPAN